MLCPKCGKEMQSGALGPSAKGLLFWAKNEYFQSKTAFLRGIHGAVKHGAMLIPVRNGHRTKAWACEDCKYVLIDCN